MEYLLKFLRLFINAQVIYHNFCMIFYQTLDILRSESSNTLFHSVILPLQG